VAKKGAKGPIFEGETPGRFPPELTFSERVAEVRDSPNSLRIEWKIISHPHDNGNVLNRSSMDIDLFNTNLLDEI
jgi:hypothetical protein